VTLRTSTVVAVISIICYFLLTSSHFLVVLFRLNFRQQRFAVSLTYFERALDMMQKKYGHDSAQLISVYQSLGRVSFHECCIVHCCYSTAFCI